MTPWVSRLLITNILVFALQWALPWVTGEIAYVPGLILQRPWTVLTYMFAHGSITHILFNMMGLWFFGPRVEVRLGSTRFAQLYLVAGITGALLSSALAPQAALVGASAAIFGVMLAFASFWPHEKIFIWGVFPIEARWLVVLSTLFALYASRTGIEAGVAHYAHLGGYAGAWLFLRWLDATSDARRFQRKMHEAPKIPERKLADGMRGLNLEGVHELSRAEVNRILDKIGAQGMASLTPQERTFLMNFVPPDDRKRWTS